MKNDVQRFLAQEKGSDVFFTTMIDLYGIQADFPGLNEAEKLRHLPQKRVELLEQAFADDIGDRRFIPHIQLFEFETMLFVEHSQLERFFPGRGRPIAALQAIADAHPSPEVIDDGPATAPSKRIIAQISAYEQAKPAAGPQVAAQIGLTAIRARCPHFAAWLSRLEKLGEGTK